jgi:ubiquinone/menaquinone biosynthesis C-methylase UbiE
MSLQTKNIDSHNNLDADVVAGFGAEWERFDQASLNDGERDQIYADYFNIFPWDRLPEDAVGIDVGCGSGRWAKVTAKRVPRLVLMDASAQALGVARRNLADADNVTFLEASVGSIPCATGSLDFAYSLGVLHHVPDTRAAIGEIARVLKPGAPFLVYLYYAFDNQRMWYRLLWRISDIGRMVISALPHRPRHAICDVVAALVYWPLAFIARQVSRQGFRAEKWPLAYYRDKSFYCMRTDALDRFGTRLEQRFTRLEIRTLMERSGFQDIVFSDKAPFWCAVGYRSPDSRN